MIAPELPQNEKERQAAVERYRILDTLPEENYDNITSLIAHVAGAPVALITMLDKNRNYLKSHFGVPFNESPRDISFCGHAINAAENITVVEDATADPRFHDNPLVTDGGVRFYAGVPITTPDNFRLGTLCIFDTKPRTLDDNVKLFLVNMAMQVETILEHRRQNQILIEYRKQLEASNKELKTFAQMVSHDIKSPLISTFYLANSLAEDHTHQLPPEVAETVEKIISSTSSVNKYIDQMLEYYTSDKILLEEIQPINLTELLSDVEDLTDTGKECELTTLGFDETQTIVANKAALLQILVNLVSNSIKFTAVSPVKIDISFDQDQTEYRFTVSDNGVGIPEDRQQSIFDLYSQGSYNSEPGSGLGLATVKKLVERMGGTISAESSNNSGATFKFNLAKHSNY